MIQYGHLRTLMAGLPDWLALLILVVVVTWTVCMVGLAIAKTGRSPYWALLVFIPFAAVPLLWLWAYARWPRQEAAPERP
ncbi:MAG TPA: hypothetical protein VED40_00290 [Azospirillaceae bacterium]|nr:hypothetical protein [Azospirillaceae bacterium]